MKISNLLRIPHDIHLLIKFQDCDDKQNSHDNGPVQGFHVHVIFCINEGDTPM